MAINLSVNLNKVCLLRNSRGGTNPSPMVAARTCLDSGATGLTLHWRADERHTRQADVRALVALCKERGAELNLEGDQRPALADSLLELANRICFRCTGAIRVQAAAARARGDTATADSMLARARLLEQP